MVRAGCVFVAGIHPSRTWTSGSFESVRWNACVHRLDLGLYSHPKEFWGNGVWTHVNSKGKIPSTGKCPQRSIEPATLWQRAQALPTELFRPPSPGLNRRKHLKVSRLTLPWEKLFCVTFVAFMLCPGWLDLLDSYSAVSEVRVLNPGRFNVFSSTLVASVLRLPFLCLGIGISIVLAFCPLSLSLGISLC